MHCLSHSGLLSVVVALSSRETGELRIRQGSLVRYELTQRPSHIVQESASSSRIISRTMRDASRRYYSDYLDAAHLSFSLGRVFLHFTDV